MTTKHEKFLVNSLNSMSEEGGILTLDDLKIQSSFKGCVICLGSSLGRILTWRL